MSRPVGDAGMHRNQIQISSPVPFETSQGLFSEQSKTSRTPADEGVFFFELPLRTGEELIHVYEVRLDGDGGPAKERSYISLPPPLPPYVLRISLDAGTPVSKNAVLKTNFPLNGGEFARDIFVERKFPTDFSKPIHVNIPISHGGAFVYWIEYDGPDCDRVTGREGYFNIDPVLRVKSRSPIISPNLQPLSISQGGKVLSDEVVLPLNGLVVLTVVSKWMGRLSEWKESFREASERGYNMLHYTPLQQSGESNSPYSIADQMKFDKHTVGDVTGDEGILKIREVLNIAHNEYGLLSLTDVVMNHTANNSSWLLEHPEAGYSPFNTPHLAPALELDNAILDFSSNLASNGLPTCVTSRSDMDILLEGLATKLRNELKLWQYYVLDRNRERNDVLYALFQSCPEWSGPDMKNQSLADIAKSLRLCRRIEGLGEFTKRFGVHINPEEAAALMRATFPEIDDFQALADTWAKVVDIINVPLYEEWETDTKVALENIKNRLEYTRLAEHGPKLGEITANIPLVESYFTRLPHNDVTAKHNPAALSLANNGWVWDADPLQNFALQPSKAYLRREVIVWGDCVKLRYGSGPEDNPWLWKYMTEYVTSLALMFDGFRIDNCHSTPLHVGAALLDAARAVSPNLYICAELFTGNEETDIHFVSRLGINSLIREAYNGHDSRDLSRLLHRYGVDGPIGSMDAACLDYLEDLPSPTGKGPTRPCVVTPLRGSLPRALFFDLTHDNESPLHKRTAEDSLSTGALVAFSMSAIGSNKGFDDLYPKLLNLVTETRRYHIHEQSDKSGISGIKRIFNHLHTDMVLGGYSEAYVHEENNYISIHRINPSTGQGYLLIAHTAFKNSVKDRECITPIKLSRTSAQFILGASLEVSSQTIQEDQKFLTGLPAKLINVDHPRICLGSDRNGQFSEIFIPDVFPPGSVLLLSTQLHGVDVELDEFCKKGAEDAFKQLELIDLNVVLHRVDGEEKDATGGSGTYDIPDYGNLVYAGLEGWMAPLRHIVWHNDLGHPLCRHLRAGSWALEYVHDRLLRQADILPNLRRPAKWFKERFDRIKSTIPLFLRPKYFAIVIYEAYKAAIRAVIEQHTEFVSEGHDFIQNLCLCSVQVHGLVRTASLEPTKPVPCLAAGLPHFSGGWARCWGRDVFISLRGLFLTTGNYTGAKRHILAFASTLKHGLIPNLLDSARSPRYNSRDSPWWMLQSIQDYASFVPGGTSILLEPVKLRFPKDDSFVSWDDAKAYATVTTLAEIIQEILQRHADGISFREHNAGPKLDSQMTDQGFNIDIHVDWSTGFIFGGNRYNCGTWMDKMGESEKAGNKGVPGTPRDGAPVEVIGLLKSTLRWLDELSQRGDFPYKGVNATVDGQHRLLMYKEWGNLIQASFERCFYIPPDPSKDSEYVINQKIVNRRGIYKDVFGSSSDHEWCDYQLRPNFPIAMTVAPELFNPLHALGALKIADTALRGPLGMKTLDPSDMQYRGDYNNSNDSTDPTIAKGFNYHNGPEWGWPLGYFLRAYLYFDTKVGDGRKDQTITLHYVHSAVVALSKHLNQDIWRGLPELTNNKGAICRDSCPTQAWSASTILDFFHDVHKFQLSP